jgi:hypothetical protein
MTDLMSRPYAPSTEKCCERCVFGTGPHAAWCERANARNRNVDRTAEELARDFNGIFTGTRTAPRRRA